ncbi:MAG: heparin lyase I family protein [Candidatus Pacebacteria bacterium]|nr:heparin lyase I family protein [Candidatus Paceibacterota bacterium]
MILILTTAASTSAVSADTTEGDGFLTVYRTSWAAGIDPRLQLQESTVYAISVLPLAEFGGVALRTAMSRSDDFSTIANGAPRVEVAFTPVARFAVGGDYEVRWSTMIPAGYPLDGKQSEIISQIHQSDSNIGSPPFALMLTGNHYEVDVRGDVKVSPAKIFKFGAPSSDEGHAVRWMLRYRVDASGATAVTDLYKDGVLVVHAGAVPNAYPGDRNGYLKIGIYKWWWKTRPSDVDQRFMYYGDVEIRARRGTVSTAVPATRAYTKEISP